LKRRATGFESSLWDFSDTEEQEQFWCILCKGYFVVEAEEETPAGLFVRLSCGHVGFKENFRDLTRIHKEER